MFVLRVLGIITVLLVFQMVNKVSYRFLPIGKKHYYTSTMYFYKKYIFSTFNLQKVTEIII